MSVVRRFFVWCVLLVFEAGALLAPGRAYAFISNMSVPGFTGSPGGGGAYVPSGEARFWKGVANTTAIVEAAGKTASVGATARIASNAGSVIMAGIRAAGPWAIAAAVAVAIEERYGIIARGQEWIKTVAVEKDGTYYCAGGDPPPCSKYGQQASPAGVFAAVVGAMHSDVPGVSFGVLSSDLPNAYCGMSGAYAEYYKGYISRRGCIPFNTYTGKVVEMQEHPATDDDWPKPAVADEDMRPRTGTTQEDGRLCRCLSSRRRSRPRLCRRVSRIHAVRGKPVRTGGGLSPTISQLTRLMFR
jgi:hypothetical protein